jgi:N-acetylneuraminic acid mutarotase
MERFGASLVVVFAAAFVASAPAQTGGQGHWGTKAPLPVEIGEVSVAALQGKIYVVGGAVRDAPNQFRSGSNTNLEYDPASNTWRQRAPLPWEASHMALATLDGKLFAFGGFRTTVHAEARDLAAEYDPAKDAWSALPPLSSPRGAAAAVALGDKIHVIGGRGLDKVTIANHEVLDPKARTWSKAAPLPLARDHIGVVVFDGKIHVYGGRTGEGGSNVARHDVYDPASDSWKEATPLPMPRSAGAATVYRGLLLYAGGECKPGGKPGENATFDDVTGYDPKTNTWATLAPLPQGRHAVGAATVGDVAYFAGGALTCGGGGTSQLLTFTLP